MNKITIKSKDLEHIKERSSYNRNFYRFIPSKRHIILEEYSEMDDDAFYWQYSADFKCLAFLGSSKYQDWENREELVIDLFGTLGSLVNITRL